MAIKTDEFGIVTFDEIEDQLSPCAAIDFSLAMQSLIKQPNNRKRNAKYADYLTEHFEKSPFFTNGDSWKNMEIVTFNKLSDSYLENELNELTSIHLRTSKRGRHGFVVVSSVFIGAGYTRLPGYMDEYLCYLILNDDKCEIISDDKIRHRFDEF